MDGLRTRKGNLLKRVCKYPQTEMRLQRPLTLSEQTCFAQHSEYLLGVQRWSEDGSPFQSLTRQRRLLDKAVHVSAVTAGGGQKVESGVVGVFYVSL